MVENINLSENDIQVLRELGEWKAKASGTPENREKIKAWQEHDEGVKGSRVMVRAETWYTTDPEHTVNETDLKCRHPWARRLERDFRFRKHEIEILKDDSFVLPFAEYHSNIERSDFGLPSSLRRKAENDLAFNYTPVLTKLDDGDFKKIRHTTLKWNKEEEESEKATLEKVFKGILKVRRRSGIWIPTTSTCLNFVGLEGFMLLQYDNPSGLKRLMQFITDDHLALIDFMEQNKLFELNNESDYIGSGCMGCSRLLPAKDYKGIARAKDLWFYCESQESVSISPEAYGEFVFPYIKALSDRFGRVYYGCCEPVDPVWPYIKNMKNLKRLSVSPWADEEKVGRICRENKLVYSRKMSPNYFMGEKLKEEEVRRSAEKTVNSAAGASLEFILRDVYTLGNEPERFVRWVEIVREAGQGTRYRVKGQGTKY